MDIEPNDPILRVPDIAELCGCPIGTVRFWASTGVGPPTFKLGGRRVARRSKVLQWIAEQEAATTTGGGIAS